MKKNLLVLFILSALIIPLNTASASTIITGPNYSLEFKIATDWGTGFTGEITITNTGTTAINNWHLGFKTNITINNIWNAGIVSYIHDYYTLCPPEWNKSIAPGASYKIGFTGKDHATGFNVEIAELFGDGIIPQPGYEDYDSFITNLKTLTKNSFLGQNYLIDITNNYGSNHYNVDIYYDPAAPRPTLLGLVSWARFSFIRTSDNLVKVNASSFVASYQGFYNPPLDSSLMLEGIRLCLEDKVLTSKTMGNVVNIIPSQREGNSIYFYNNNIRYKVTREANGQITLTKNAPY